MLSIGFEKLIRWMNGAGVVWIFAIMLMICADIVGRNVFDSPIAFVPEAVSLSLVGCVFLQLAYALHQNRLTRAEFLLNKFQDSHPALILGWKTLLAVLAVAILLLMTIGAWPDFVRAFRTAEFAGVEGNFTIQVWPIKLIIVVGALIAACECLREAFHGDAARSSSQVNASGVSQRSWAGVGVVLLLAAGVAILWLGNFSQQTVGGFMIAGVLLLIALGMPIAIALLITGFVGLAVLKQDFGIATRTLSLAAEGTISEYVFATVPLIPLPGVPGVSILG